MVPCQVRPVPTCTDLRLVCAAPQVQAATIAALSSNLVALASTVAVQASNQVVLTNELTAQEGATEALRRELLAQNATIASQGSTILAQNTTIASQGRAIATQSSAIAGSAEYPCILGDATETTLHIGISWTNPSASTLRAARELSRCRVLVGTVLIESGFENSTMLSEVFGNVRVLAGELLIRRSGLFTLGSAFQHTTDIQAIAIEDNNRLASLGSAFGNLQRVSVYTGSYKHRGRGRLSISNNGMLEALGPTAFGNMTRLSVGGQLNFDRAGDQSGDQADTQRTAGSARFCSSARARLCPLTERVMWVNNDYVDSTDDCCAAYCTTRTDC